MLITAELPEEVFAWADSLRRAHYPPERNRLGAHVTLFHALPPSAGDAVRSIMTRMSRRPPPKARVSGLMDLGSGTALAIDCPELEALHAEMAESLYGLTQPKDSRPLRLHITVQNRVSPGAARQLQKELARDLEPLPFRFHGLGLSLWHRELWRLAHVYPFRGQG